MSAEKPLRPFAFLALTVCLMGSLALAYSVRVAPVAPTVELVLLLSAAVLSESYALRLRSFTMSLAFPLFVAAMVMFGPAGSGLVAAASFTNLSEIKERRPLSAIAFNFGQLAVSGCAAGWAYVALGSPTLVAMGEVSALSPAEAPAAVAGALIAAAVFSAANLVFIVAGVWVGRGVPPREVVKEFLGYLPTQVALALVGLLIAQVLAINPLAFPLFLFPLFLARQIYQRYTSLSETYVDTVRSLIGALEAKDPYTRGHSERVARYAVELASHLGWEDADISRLERAALLHDIGKLTQAASVLSKPARLTEAEFDAMRRHPEVGSTMIERIPPLRQLAPLVGSHHERPDGRGYPNGLRASEIPADSLILAIADAYDAMTTTRAYRGRMSHEQALAELMAGADTQFDAHMVSAFAAASIESSDDTDALNAAIPSRPRPSGVPG